MGKCQGHLLGLPMAGAWWKVPESCHAAFCPTDNLWSAYTDKGVFVEKKGTPSVPVLEESRASGLPYVLTDIMTYFTMLVGIYFPSVTGEARAAPPSRSSHTPNPVPRFLSCLAQATSFQVSAPVSSEGGP